MNEALRDQLALLPGYLSRHLLLTVVSLLIGVGLSFPLAIILTRVRWMRGPVLAIASAIQTVPSLALLALMVPLLRQIGFLPAAIALILYSMLPVIRNTVTGIEEVDANLIEAGRGLGMTPHQLLVKVQIPLALPVIIAGVRTATVWVVGIATLSTPVGATSLGNYIFSGLQTQNYTAIMVGCVAAAGLALLLDLLIRVMEIASTRRSMSMVVTATLGVLIVVGGGLSPLLFSGSNLDHRPRAIVGAKTFTEQYILASFITKQLDSAGYRVRQLDSLGSTVVFDALVNGDVDCYVDYTGTIWANHMQRADRASANEVLRHVTEWLRSQHNIECLGRLGFENTYALAMPRAEAEQLGIKSIDDLFRYAADMKIGGDYEFFGRPEWERLRAEYEIEFAETVGMDSTLMYTPVDTDDIDIIAAFSTDGRIVAHDLLILDDPRAVFPPYDAILLVGSAAAARPGFVDALRPLLGAVNDEAMRNANKIVDVDRQSVTQAAESLKAIVNQ